MLCFQKQYKFLFAGYSALHQAALWGRTECVQVLIEAGADLSKYTDYNERPRECAQRYGQDDCIEALDKSGIIVLEVGQWHIMYLHNHPSLINQSINQPIIHSSIHLINQQNQLVNHSFNQSLIQSIKQIM